MTVQFSTLHAPGMQDTTESDGTSWGPPALRLDVALDHGTELRIGITLPPLYPDIPPVIMCRYTRHVLCFACISLSPASRAEGLRRDGLRALNTDLQAFVAGLTPGEPCCFQAIEWVQENIARYIPPSEDASATSVSRQSTSTKAFQREFVYDVL